MVQTVALTDSNLATCSGKKVWVLSFAIVLTVGLMSPESVLPVESGRLVEKDGKYVFVESIDPALKLMLERSVKQGIITQEEYEKVLKESEVRSYLLQPSFKAWYDRGFNFSMNDNAYFLKIRARFQIRLTQRFRNDAYRNPGDAKNFPELLGVFGDYRANRSENDSTHINLRRVRLYFMGHLFSPDLKYYIQLRGETAENSQSPGFMQLFDFNMTSTHLNWLNVQFGQYKVYFNRAQINATSSMQFPERAQVMDAFTASGLDRRDIGITFMNDEEVYPINYYFGLHNGAGPSFTRLGTFISEQPTEACPGGQTAGQPPGCPAEQRNINADTRIDVDRFMATARLMWNVMGRPGYGEGDMAYSEAPQMAIGGGYSYNPGVNTATGNGFVGIDLANLNFRRQLAAFGNGRQLGWGIIDYSTWGLDAVFKFRGFSLQGEYYFKNVIRHEKGFPCVVRDNAGVCTQFAPHLLGNATGWYVQSGYYLIPRYLEIAGRYAWWDPDTHSASDLIKQVDVSLNWFLSGTYDHQIMLSYSNVAMGTGGFALGRSAPLPGGNVALVSSGTVPLDAKGGTLIENAIRLQYQIFF